MGDLQLLFKLLVKFECEESMEHDKARSLAINEIVDTIVITNVKSNAIFFEERTPYVAQSICKS